MGIDQGSSTITTNKSDRNWRTELFQDVDGSEQLRFHRELVATDTTTQEVVARDRGSIPTVQRTSQQVASKSYTASGITATGLQIMRLMYKMADTERQWDIDHPPVPPATA
jgi:hypothetical protein